MAKFYDALNESLREFIGAQRVFFNTSAPNKGRINVSPKGQDTFRILSDTSVAYLDLTGSECETAAHIAENGRLTLMFCSFQEEPLIVRLYGRGWVVRPRDARWHALRGQFPGLPGERQIIGMDIESIMTTCGFAVPLFDYRGEREQLAEFTCKMGDEKMDDYRRRKNQQSIDGLPTHLFDDSPIEKSENKKRGMHYLLFYEKAPDHAERGKSWQAAHRTYVLAAAKGGDLVLAGSMTDPDDGAAVLLFRSESPATAEAFAANDPYVLNGVISRWHVRPWQTVVGESAAFPLPEA